MRDIDEMTDEEVEAYLAGHAEVSGAPVESRRTAWLMMICAGIGMIASLELVLAQFTLSKDSNASLLCDINQLVGCSDFLTSKYNAIFFGIPNAAYGMLFFAGIFALGLAIASGAVLARWLWRLVALGLVAASAWLLWFQTTAVFAERLLCPWCVVTWIATIPLIIHLLARIAAAGHLGGLTRLGEAVVGLRWVLTAAVYLTVAAVVVIGLWDKISAVL